MPFFGNSWDDPQTMGVLALASGLLDRNPARGIMEMARYNSPEARAKLAMSQLDLRKGNIEVSEMERKARDAAEARKVIQEFYAKNGILGSVAGGGAPAPAPPVEGGGILSSVTPSAGGAPAPSAIPTARPQPTMPQGAPSLPPMPQSAPQGSVAPKSQLWQQYRMLGDALAQKGQIEQAQHYWGLAEKSRPKYGTEPRVVMGPNGKLINILTAEDGTSVELPYGVKPNIKIVNLGGRQVAIDENATQGGQSWENTMTPGEVASNRVAQGNLAVAQGNLKNAQERLDLERNAPHYLEVNGEVIAVPKNLPRGASPAGIVVPGVGGAGGGFSKLTEAQSKAMAFAARMQDATGTLDGLEGRASPMNVNRAGYKSDVPWFLGGNATGGVLDVANRATVPADAERIYQAQSNWVTANLRKESGAVITPAEMQAEIFKWFPQPGESSEVIEQKRRARLVQQEAMVAEAGPGGKQIPGILDRARQQADRKGGGMGASARNAKPLPANPDASSLVKDQAYDLGGGRTGVWDGYRFKVTK